MVPIESRNRASIHRVLLSLPAIVVAVWVFRRVLFFGEVFSYRDAGHFYYPLFAFVRATIHSGSLPLWNPYENLGEPLAACATTCLFYPPAWIMWAPGPFHWWFCVYVLAHVVWGGWGAYIAARLLGCRREGALTAAVGYMLSGPVLFQTSNVVFLTGAAWLPWMFTRFEMLTRDQRPQNIIWAATVTAMPVLGGDPQLVYHFALLWFGRLLCRFLLDHGKKRAPGTASRQARGSVLLAASAAFACAGLLAAVQILPSAEYARRSDRAVIASRLSVWSNISHLSGGRGTDVSSDHSDAADLAHADPFVRLETIPYQFSVGWWRLGELIWPNFGGKPFPRNQRWMEALPAEGRLWCPSLYQGVVPLVLALAGLQFMVGRGRASSSARVFLSWMVLLAILLSMGWYGAGWWLRELGVTQGDGISPPVGGLYWLLVTFAPGYAQFRYPAKWFTFASFGIALLSATGTTELLRNRLFRRRVMRTAAGAAVASLIVLVPWMLLRERLFFQFAQADPHPIFGPLDAIGAHRIATWGVIHSLVILTAFAVILAQGPRLGGYRRLIGVSVIVLTAVDLAQANGWLVVSTPRALREESSILTKIADSPALSAMEAGDDRDDMPLRIDRPFDWFPRRWRYRSSDDRLAEWLRWEQATLAPKQHLCARPHFSAKGRPAVVESFGTMLSAEYLDVLLLATADSPGAGEKPSWFDDLVGTAVRLRPSVTPFEPATASHAWDQIMFEWDDAPIDASLRAPPPHAFLVEDVSPLSPADVPEQGIEKARAALFAAGRPRDLRREAVVVCSQESGYRDPILRALFAHAPSARKKAPALGRCRVCRYRAGHLEIEVEIETPALLVVREQFDPNWRATVTSLSDAGGPNRVGSQVVRPLQTDHVLLGIPLPAGRYRVQLDYRPVWLYLGSLLSAAAWLAAGGMLFYSRRRT
ncbi:hypothetical protein JCM19992_12400 [Thermostilla marina]